MFQKIDGNHWLNCAADHPAGESKSAAARFDSGTYRFPEHCVPAAITRFQGDHEKMKRLLLIGVAACAFAVMPMLPASAMPRATADTLLGDTDNSMIRVHGGGHGHSHMGRGGRGHHYGWGRGHHHGWH
jgi:hypothetical protein